MHYVKDGPRTLEFEGRLLGESTSKRSDSIRWIEFKLYQTESGAYVLSRVGRSKVYHTAACALVSRYALTEIEWGDLDFDALECTECSPSQEAQLVFPEKNRHWAQVSDEPHAVLEALYKYDDGGARYLTKVAQRLLESASKNDQRIESVYKIERIP